MFLSPESFPFPSTFPRSLSRLSPLFVRRLPPPPPPGCLKLYSLYYDFRLIILGTAARVLVLFSFVFVLLGFLLHSVLEREPRPFKCRVDGFPMDFRFA